MTVADKVTSIRIILAPIFFIIYLLPNLLQSVIDAPPAGDSPFTPLLKLLWVIVLWVLFIASEITDLLDGKIARSRNETSDFGKLFDPFSDTLVRITYFLCFVIDGMLPALLLLIVLYREFSIQFLRNLLLKKGIVQGARGGGKVKAVTYMITGAVTLLAVSVKTLDLSDRLFSVLRSVSISIFVLSVILAILSFLDYLNVYRKS
ncbi:MAG: CDP-diacylglycerol--glycerol-3-phosphate 3-phosphatidyltransferase [Treponema sp.]|nr:CDP-diacylglycerol--glycerol-3-phosphate 3-phosphatidyltransferase [Treponema sp.]